MAKNKAKKQSDGKKVTALSLFSGGGGLDLGLAAAGFKIACSTDIDFYSCKTLAINTGKKPFYKHGKVVQSDITLLTTDQLLNEAKLTKTDIDIIVGGPPCQAFSVFGRRQGVQDPRGRLLWEYIRLIKDIQPTAFLFENVAGLKTIHNGRLYQDLLEALSIGGLYVLSAHNYQIADYGIPQYRDRIFFIGWKEGRRIPPMTPSHGANGLFPSNLDHHITAGMALSGLPSPSPQCDVTNHIGRVHSDRIIKRYSALRFGERDHRTRINKLHPDRPSFTIIVGSDAGGGKGHIHPFSPRELTPRESARMQTFPDWWGFYGTGRHVIRQIGNAVPPLFAALLGVHILKYVFAKNNNNLKSYRQLVDILDLDYLIPEQ